MNNKPFKKFVINPQMNLVRNLNYATLPTYRKLLRKLEIASARGRLSDFTNFEVALARVKNARDSIPQDEREPIERFLEGEGYPSVIVSGDYIKEFGKLVFKVNVYLNKYRKGAGFDETFPPEMVGTADEFFDYEFRLSQMCAKGIADFRQYMWGMDETEKWMLDYKAASENKKDMSTKFWAATERAYKESSVAT